MFFVRAPPPEGLIPDPELDPIFVKRKVNNSVPPLSDVVDWKQTFFLNLIIQLPCTLTVAICQKSTEANGERKTSILGMPSEDRVYVVPGGSDSPASDGAAGKSASTPATSNATISTNPFSPPSTPLTSQSATPTSSTTPQATKKSKMTALRRVTKKVYAAPYKSRMDVKDAFMNECSFPLVYYTVNDYESHDLHLPITDKEYLCVELSAVLPTSPSASLADLEISVEADNTPFPTPPNHNKIILFQGAVPYSSLVDIYQHKGMAAQNQLKLSWSKLANAGNYGNDRSSENASPPTRTEYIMMRGPHGKGQCQVAIAEPAAELADMDGARVWTDERDDRKVPSLTDRLKFLGTVVSKQISGVTGTGPNSTSNGPPRKPDNLKCSMTYVNVPWQSIIRYVYC